ncbi:MAG TPA: glycine zipper 2TM domain-containing protein [Steroidobacteraceae bacterium]
MVYPANGQSPEQLERDRYECHVWAVQQSGFDPSRSGVPPGERVVVQPANPPGAGTAVGAIAGAVLGAAIAGPRNAGAGLVLGGITGAAVGSASDANAQAQANYEQARLDRNAAGAEQGAANYRRAISACLDARGYTTA